MNETTKNPAREVHDHGHAHAHSHSHTHVHGDTCCDHDHHHHGPQTPVRVMKVGRNDACPCGSGKKYKKCCLG